MTGFSVPKWVERGVDPVRAAAISHAALIVNIGSRSGRRGLHDALAEFDRLGVRPKTIYDVDDARALVSATKKAIESGCELVIVGGGDGTATSICGFFMNCDTILGLLPLGTGNSFARSLELPLDVRGAVDVIATRAPRRIDLGIVNGIPFANYAALGLSANVAGSTPARLKAIFGPAAYIAIGFFATREHRPFVCRLFADDETVPRFEGPTHQVVLANGRYFGTAPILPEAEIDDGVISTFAIAGAHRRGIVGFWLKVLSGADTRELPEGTWFSSERVRVETTPIREVEVDGQALTKTPALFSVAKSAISVLA